MNEKLNELFQMGSRKNYEFHYKIIEEEKNNIITVDNENGIIYVTIGDPENEDLSIMIKDAINQLKETFK